MPPTGQRLPNLVFFIPDQYRGEALGHMGNAAVHTPNLDALVASDAISCANAFCQNPVCTPSRCSFMTGWYPHTRGHRTMGHLLQREEPNLLQRLKQAGYFVWWGGKNDLVSDPVAYEASHHVRHEAEVNHANLHSDQSWREPNGDHPDYSFFAGRLEKQPHEDVYLDSDWSHVMAAADVIRNHADKRPFCIFLPLEYPHPPYGVEEPFFSATEPEKIPPRILPETLSGKPRMHDMLRQKLHLDNRSEAWWEQLRSTYYGMCSRIDAQAGLILQALRDTRQYDDTAFFLFSDHGDYTGDYGLVEKTQNLFEDCITRVPLIFKPPASHGRCNGIRNGLVELIDFTATVYDLAGINPGYSHFGQSLLPLLQHDLPHRDAVFCSGGRMRDENHCAIEDDAGHVLKDYLYYPRLQIQSIDHKAHGKAIMCRTHRHKLVVRLYERDEFYDLTTDPGETINRIDDPTLAADRDRLRQRLQRHLLETSDIVPWTRNARDLSAASPLRATSPAVPA
ncbi:MAG: sulfatase-like hydrolase/transferase [Verrucomicrobiota bacterium]